MQADSKNDETVILSLDRARVYRALSQLFRAPDADAVEELRERGLPELCQALERLAQDSDLWRAARALCDLFDDRSADQLRRGHHDAFDESSGLRCVPNEMAQLDDMPQLELTRTFELADIAGFYRAFGVEVSPGSERADHITTELEFMHLLAVKESIALQEEGEGEHAEVCRGASRAFLRDHLGRWAPRLGECLVETNADPVYSAVGLLLGSFIAFDAARIDAQ
jgi:TorA maturation chaperone TorD